MRTFEARKNAASPRAEAGAAVPLGQLEKSIGYALRRAQIAVFSDFMVHVGGLGLRPAQFSVLLVVRETPGLKQSVVADALGIQRTNFVAMVDELQKKGWLERRAADRRSYALHLTAAGEAKIAEAMAMHQTIERRISRLLGPGGKTRLLEQLRVISEALGPASLGKADMARADLAKADLGEG